MKATGALWGTRPLGINQVLYWKQLNLAVVREDPSKLLKQLWVMVAVIVHLQNGIDRRNIPSASRAVLSLIMLFWQSQSATSHQYQSGRPSVNSQAGGGKLPGPRAPVMYWWTCRRVRPILRAMSDCDTRLQVSTLSTSAPMFDFLTCWIALRIADLREESVRENVMKTRTAPR